MKPPLPVWRSILCVPANVDRFVVKAQARGADAIMLDLEDSVAPADKESARQKLGAALDKLAGGPSDIGVRINRPLDLAVRDIEAALRPGVSFLTLPKVAGPQHVQLLAELVEELEGRRGLDPCAVRFIVLVETAEAFRSVGEIARAHPRVAGLILGSEDFALACGLEPTAEALAVPKQIAVIAAHAAGVLPLGLVGSPAEIGDMNALRLLVRRSRALGLTGAVAVHPDQVAVFNEEFAPSQAAVEEAKRLLAEAKGRPGAFAHAGRMVDRPVLDRAAELLERAAAIERRGRREPS